MANDLVAQVREALAQPCGHLWASLTLSRKRACPACTAERVAAALGSMDVTWQERLLADTAEWYVKLSPMQAALATLRGDSDA